MVFHLSNSTPSTLCVWVECTLAVCLQELTAQKELDSLVSRHYVCAGNQTIILLTTELSLYPKAEVLKQQEYVSVC